MKCQSVRLGPILLSLILLLLAAPTIATKGKDVADTAISADGSPQPSLAAQSPVPQKPLLGKEGGPLEDGSAEVEKALVYLRRFEKQAPRASRKPVGTIGTVTQYALSLLPKFNAQGPLSKPAAGSKGLPKPLATAVGLLEEAERLHNNDATYILAEMNFFGNFSYPRNYEEAFSRYHALATMGNSSAQHMVGFMYATGIGGIERDQAKALLYYTFAASGGNSRSQMAVAFRHYSGIGTARRCEVAVKHYKSVADKAIEWYRSGPPGGMAWVLNSYSLADDVGGVYGEGASYSSSGKRANTAGVNSDASGALEDVLEYYDMLSRKGDFIATFSLGELHYNGRKGLPRNWKIAKFYFMKVAKLYWQRNGAIIESETKKHPKLERYATLSAGFLGKMFLRGEGVEQSFEKAQTWYNRGIKSGDAGSQYGLGLMYRDGHGFPKNPLKAENLFKAAAEQDYAHAQVALGALYLDQGNVNHIPIAHGFFELAQRHGSIEATYYLAELSNQGLGRERSCGSATQYYKSVAEKAEPLLSTFAEANDAFQNGDRELAVLDFLLAAEQGYERGQANVAYMLDQEKSKWSLPSWLAISARPPVSLHDSELALMYWTRSAKQSNIDSLVKMGDYYMKGVGALPDMDKAASCYTAASEYYQSAQALYNLGWMHENGVGLDQDFHLAKRYYDHALETSIEAWLPVTLSLFKLRLRSAWNTLTHGKINSIQDEPALQKEWSLSEWIKNFLLDDYDHYANRYADDDENYLAENSPMPGGDVDGMYDDVIYDGLGILDYMLAIAFVTALIALVYHRQRVAAEVERQRAERNGHQQQFQQPQQEDRGLFPQPADPDFNQWVAGGVGH